MKLNELAPAPGSRKTRKRVGRGVGSGFGKTGARRRCWSAENHPIHPLFDGRDLCNTGVWHRPVVAVWQFSWIGTFFRGGSDSGYRLCLADGHCDGYGFAAAHVDW